MHYPLLINEQIFFSQPMRGLLYQAQIFIVLLSLTLFYLYLQLFLTGAIFLINSN